MTEIHPPPEEWRCVGRGRVRALSSLLSLALHFVHPTKRIGIRSSFFSTDKRIFHHHTSIHSPLFHRHHRHHHEISTSVCSCCGYSSLLLNQRTYCFMKESERERERARGLTFPFSRAFGPDRLLCQKMGIMRVQAAKKPSVSAYRVAQVMRRKTSTLAVRTRPWVARACTTWEPSQRTPLHLTTILSLILMNVTTHVPTLRPTTRARMSAMISFHWTYLRLTLMLDMSP